MQKGVLRALGARLTRAERVVAVLLAIQPALWLLVGFPALVVSFPLLALLLAVPFVVVSLVAGWLLAARLRRRARHRTDPQVAGALGVSLGSQADKFGVVIDSPLPARRRSAESLAAKATRTTLLRSGQASRAAIHRDALALRATAGRFDLEGLLALARTEPAGSPAWRLADSAELLALVRLIASASAEPAGFGALLHVAVAIADAAPHADRIALVGILLSRGESDAARRALGTVEVDSWGHRAAVVDLLSPFAAGGDVAGWLAAINSFFDAAGIEPVSLTARDGLVPFGRLQAPEAVHGSVSGPLVSVVMTVHRPDVAALRAAESVCAQTWADWELLVLDDASGIEYDGILTELSALDARIHVVRAERNAGTYARRNDGLDLARGQYVTFHDSDDWSHPRRLEIQVRALERHPQTPGVVVSALRATSELRLWQDRGIELRLCEPSLLMRRELALARAGYFDSVRKGGDVEYRERLGAAAGAAVMHVRSAAPLVMMHADPGTLSGSDFSEGWAHPARVAYRSAHRWWRATARRRGIPLRRERDEVLRPFPAPDHTTGADDEHVHDILLLADLGDRVLARRDARRLIAAVRQGRAAGLSVAVRSTASALTASDARDLDPRLLTAIFGAGAELRVLGERVVAGELIVFDPAVLLALPDGEDGARPARVTLVPARRRSTPAFPDPAAEDTVARRWHVLAQWAPELRFDRIPTAD